MACSRCGAPFAGRGRPLSAVAFSSGLWTCAAALEQLATLPSHAASAVILGDRAPLTAVCRTHLVTA
eukprot:2346671-Pyramimonas_sp.AAC.1